MLNFCKGCSSLFQTIQAQKGFAFYAIFNVDSPDCCLCLVFVVYTCQIDFTTFEI